MSGQEFSGANRCVPESDPPRPAHWGGYILVADSIEFWQGREHRFHDRLLYEREARGWRLTRLFP